MSRLHDQLERLTFFADAVFAIAMTLLVVDVKLPHVAAPTDAALGQALLDLIPAYIAFLVSFLMLLLAVAFMPFPTSVVSQFASERTGVGVYAAWLLLLGLLNRHVAHVVAADPGLLAADADHDAVRQHLIRSWIPIVISVAAFAVAMILPLPGIAVLVVGSPVVTRVLQRRAERLSRG